MYTQIVLVRSDSDWLISTIRVVVHSNLVIVNSFNLAWKIVWKQDEATCSRLPCVDNLIYTLVASRHHLRHSQGHYHKNPSSTSNHHEVNDRRKPLPRHRPRHGSDLWNLWLRQFRSWNRQRAGLQSRYHIHHTPTLLRPVQERQHMPELRCRQRDLPSLRSSDRE